MKLRADLHLHTYYSDGAVSPAWLVGEAKTRGVDIIALTDHDCMNGMQEFLAACKGAGLRGVVGAEISTCFKGAKVHILGYNLDLNSAIFEAFRAKYVEITCERTEYILKKMRALGVHLTVDEVLSLQKTPLSPIHSRSITVAAEILGRCEDMSKFYREHRNIFMDDYDLFDWLTPQEGVRLIASCGGWSCFAHPGRIALDDSTLYDLMKDLKSQGLCGIEAVYSGHTIEQTQHYRDWAERFGLIVTGGSDCHGVPAWKKTVGVPEFYPDEALLSALKIE